MDHRDPGLIRSGRAHIRLQKVPEGQTLLHHRYTQEGAPAEQKKVASRGSIRDYCVHSLWFKSMHYYWEDTLRLAISNLSSSNSLRLASLII